MGAVNVRWAASAFIQISRVPTVEHLPMAIASHARGAHLAPMAIAFATKLGPRISKKAKVVSCARWTGKWSAG